MQKNRPVSRCIWSKCRGKACPCPDRPKGDGCHRANARSGQPQGLPLQSNGNEYNSLSRFAGSVLSLLLIALFVCGGILPVAAGARPESDAQKSQSSAPQTSAPQASAPQTRVILASLDGFAYHIWSKDPVTSQLRSLRRIAARGVTARGMIQAFPSVTPVGHASLWTGAYSNVNGIASAENRLLPRNEHTAFEQRSGYDGDLLRAEPLWVTAARQGVSVVAHQTTQNYPFAPVVTGPGRDPAPVLVSGYGPRMLAPGTVIRAANSKPEDSGEWTPALPKSALPVRAFSWTVKDVTFHGALVAEKNRAQGYTAMFVAIDRKGPRVRVAPAPLESAPPRARALARHFSEGLPLAAGEKATPTIAYFRLFELARDGGDFFLYQPGIYELAMYDGTENSRAVVKTILKEAGGFIGNGPSYLYSDGLLGKQLYAGGNGTAERRYLEGMEMVIRQFNRLTNWLYDHYHPRLLMDYCPYPDEMEHTWYGLARPDVTRVAQKVKRRIDIYRRWGYAAIDTRVALLDKLAGAGGYLIFVSDHGMSPIAKEVRVNVALRDAGLLFVNDEGRIDQSRTKAFYLKYSVLLNTKDWLGGIVPTGERDAVADEVERALRKVRDPETGRPVFTRFFKAKEYADEFGIGGPADGDVYFELSPGYAVSDSLTGDVVTQSRAPYGAHGFRPTRDEMLASFITRGPLLPHGLTIKTIRSIDVAPFVADLLGIKPPANSLGHSPLSWLERLRKRR